MKEASRIIETFKNSDTKRILYHALNVHDTNINNISEPLNLREAVVHKALLKQKKDFNIGVGIVDKEKRKR